MNESHACAEVTRPPDERSSIFNFKVIQITVGEVSSTTRSEQTFLSIVD